MNQAKRQRCGDSARRIRLLAVAGLVFTWALGAFAGAGDTPVTPNALPQTQALFSFFWDTYGKKILSGQQDGNESRGRTPFEIDYIRDKTGKLPAVRAFDFSPYTPPGQHDSRLQITERAMDWYLKSNGIVSFCWHWRAPVGDPAIYAKDTQFDLRRGLTEGTPEHAAILRDLDIVAGELAILRDAHVPVLWRPLHEANGRWFWWGAQGDPEPFKKLWRLMFERFTVQHKLNNLIWVFSPGAAVDLAGWYPGDPYVDIIGQDHYPMDNNDGPVKDVFDQLVAFGHAKKLIALSENGPIPSPDRLVSEKAGWLFFTTWSGNSLTQRNSVEHLKQAYENPYVLNLDGLPGLKNYPFTPAAAATKLGFFSPPGDLAVNQSGRQPVTVAVQDAAGRTVRDGQFLVELKLGTNPGGGALGGTLTATSVNGIATFPDLRIDKPGAHFVLTASATGLASAVSPAFNVGPGDGILREWWSGISGPKPVVFTNLVSFAGPPAGSEVLGAAFEVPYSFRSDFAERLRGGIAPPATGAYAFGIVSDGSSELWLSTDRTPEKKVKIAEITSGTAYSKWPHSHEAWSAPVQLEAGRHYYIEVLHLQPAGGANLCVSWRLPGGAVQQPIPAARLFSPGAEQLALETAKKYAAGNRIQQ